MSNDTHQESDGADTADRANPSIDGPENTKPKSGPIESGVGFGGLGILVYFLPRYMDLTGQFAGILAYFGIAIVVFGSLIALTGIDWPRSISRDLIGKVLGFAFVLLVLHFVSEVVPRPLEIGLKTLNVFVLFMAWVLAMGELGKAFKRRKARVADALPSTLRSSWKSLIGGGRDNVELASALMIAALNALAAIILVLQQVF
jgi:hypothetical protein